jgi:membrane protein YdbS with pleckstrin-like domain
MFELAAKALEEGMGLSRAHQRVLWRVFWVLGVSGHILWVCGFLTAVGLSSPFARADDVDKLMRAAQVNARISMQQELRVQIRTYCATSDDDIKALAMRRIDELRNDLFEIAKIRTPEPQCQTPQQN